MMRSMTFVAAVAMFSMLGGCSKKKPVKPSPTKLVTVPAGTKEFVMGCTKGKEKYCLSGFAEPAHAVKVDTFQIEVTEVTAHQFALCVKAGKCKKPSTSIHDMCTYERKKGRKEFPMNCVTWDQARSYCAWIGRRLCSEAEWEKAARGTDGRVYPWGKGRLLCKYLNANLNQDGCEGKLIGAVGSKPAGASPYGVLDMLGRVFEWVEDDFHRSYKGAPTDGSAWVDKPRGSKRVKRGGAFDIFQPGGLVTYTRSYDEPGAARPHHGFRCCK